MIARWWQTRIARKQERQRLATLDAALAIPLDQRDPARVFPVILHGKILNLDWVGPCLALRGTPFALVWAEVREGNAWTYVTHAMADRWTRQGIDWQRVAFQNLCHASNPPANGEKCTAAGHPFLKFMLQSDAFGPSRLLIPGAFSEELGPHYRVAIPEQTCAVAFGENLADEDAETVEKLIAACFETGSEPMSPEHFDPALFWQPAESAGC